MNKKSILSLCLIAMLSMSACEKIKLPAPPTKEEIDNGKIDTNEKVENEKKEEIKNDNDYSFETNNEGLKVAQEKGEYLNIPTTYYYNNVVFKDRQIIDKLVDNEFSTDYLESFVESAINNGGKFKVNPEKGILKATWKNLTVIIVSTKDMNYVYFSNTEEVKGIKEGNSTNIFNARTHSLNLKFKTINKPVEINVMNNKKIIFENIMIDEINIQSKKYSSLQEFIDESPLNKGILFDKFDGKGQINGSYLMTAISDNKNDKTVVKVLKTNEDSITITKIDENTYKVKRNN